MRNLVFACLLACVANWMWFLHDYRWDWLDALRVSEGLLLVTLLSNIAWVVRSKTGTYYPELWLAFVILGFIFHSITWIVAELFFLSFHS